jgi:hypothetical protein
VARPFSWNPRLWQNSERDGRGSLPGAIARFEEIAGAAAQQGMLALTGHCDEMPAHRWSRTTGHQTALLPDAGIWKRRVGGPFLRAFDELRHHFRWRRRMGATDTAGGPATAPSCPPGGASAATDGRIEGPGGPQRRSAHTQSWHPRTRSDTSPHTSFGPFRRLPPRTRQSHRAAVCPSVLSSATSRSVIRSKRRSSDGRRGLDSRPPPYQMAGAGSGDLASVPRAPGQL